MDLNLEEIIKRCQKKESNAQELLFKKYNKLLMGICLRYCKSRFDAEDVFQEAFIKIFEKIDQFKADGSFEGWIRRITVNTCLKKIQYEKTNLMVDIADHHEDQPEFDDEIISTIASKELLQMINELPIGYKTVFNLFVVEGYSHKEISDLLNISEGTSKSQFFHAKKMLKSKLQNFNIVRYESR